MTRNTELHERFADWLTSRTPGAAEDPPRDLALHAAGCERCLNSATAFDTLDAIDVAAAVRVDHVGGEPARLLRMARYAVAGVALVLVAGSVAIGSSWLGSGRVSESAEPGASTAEGVLAGVPTSPASTRIASSPSASPSVRQSRSPEPTDQPDETAAPPPVIPQPTFQPIPTPAPTLVPTVTPTVTAAPTPTPVPPTPTPTPPTPTPTPPTPTPTPLPDTDGDGVPDTVDECLTVPAGPTPDPARPGCPLP